MSGTTAFFLFLMTIPIAAAIGIWAIVFLFSRLRRGNDLNRDATARLTALWQQANELDQRTATLETLLDQRDATWRQRVDDGRL
jgi:phage shock protein B